MNAIKTAHTDRPVDDSGCEPSLLDLPEEVRQMIFEQLFARERILCFYRSPSWPRIMPYWSLAILQTSHIMYVEAKRALRVTISGLELTYYQCLPPSPYYEQAAGSGPVDKNDHAMDRHVRFLRQYGGLITKMRSLSPRTAYFSFNLLPNLTTLSLRYNLVLRASKQELRYSSRTMSKTSLFRCFRAWCDPLHGVGMISPALLKLIEAPKGVERAFSVHVEMLLAVDREHFYVSLQRVRTRTTSDHALEPHDLLR